MTVEEELAKLNSNIAKLLAVNQLEYNFDQTRYLAQKVRAGEATTSKGSFFQLVGPGATFIVNFTNPAGFVWILHFVSLRVSQDAVFEETINIDDALEPWIYFPRTVDSDIPLKEMIPYDLVVKERAQIVSINHDALAQWGMVSWLATFLRKDVWERDIAIINQSAMAFSVAQPPTPAPIK